MIPKPVLNYKPVWWFLYDFRTIDNKHILSRGSWEKVSTLADKLYPGVAWYIDHNNVVRDSDKDVPILISPSLSSWSQVRGFYLSEEVNQEISLSFKQDLLEMLDLENDTLYYSYRELLELMELDDFRRFVKLAALREKKTRKVVLTCSAI